MEVIQLSGYTLDEKLHIAKNYLVPRQIEENGLESDQIEFEDEALKVIADEYTREAGVRNLERQIGTVCRKIARDAAEGKLDGKAVISADRCPRAARAAEVLRGAGPPHQGPGVATGLAWTRSAARCCSSRRPRWMARGTSRSRDSSAT